MLKGLSSEIRAATLVEPIMESLGILLFLLAPLGPGQVQA